MKSYSFKKIKKIKKIYKFYDIEIMKCNNFKYYDCKL